MSLPVVHWTNTFPSDSKPILVCCCSFGCITLDCRSCWQWVFQRQTTVPGASSWFDQNGKSVVCRASSGIGCSNHKGRFRALNPDLTKMEKTLSAGPLLVLDVPTTKDGPRHFILIWPKQKKGLSAGPLLAMGVPMTKDAPGCFILIWPKWKKHCPQGLIWHWMFQWQRTVPGASSWFDQNRKKHCPQGLFWHW